MDYVDMNLIDIKDRSGLVRDMSSGAILNTNQSEYENYLMMKQKKKHQQEQINNLINEVDELKSLVKTLIKALSPEVNQ